MTITYAICVYFIPVAALCFGLLLAREYGWSTVLRIIAYQLLREADRADRAQDRHAMDIRARLEKVA